MLNHDGAGGDEAADKTFLRERRYEDLSQGELRELDALADLLARQPSVEELVKFYERSRTLRIKGAESDSYSFVHRGR